MNFSTPLTAKDFYKTDHEPQYPEGTEYVYANFTPRSDRLFNGLDKYWDGKIVWQGLQAVLIDFFVTEFNRDFFDLPRRSAVRAYKRRLDTSLGPDAVDVSSIYELHDLGYLPLRIKSLPEGTRVGMKVPVLTMVNTDPRFGWLVNSLETVSSSEIWPITTVATIAFEFRKILTHWARMTGAPLDFVGLQGHDFSFRGLPGRFAARMMGQGHLASFVGTDNMMAIDGIEMYYGDNAEEYLIGCSVPATEHSVMCMGGAGTNEKATFRRLFTELYPTGIISIVSDTWDYWKVITEYLPEFKDEIMARQPNALGLNKVVIRPDSGDPVRIICGYDESEYFTFTCDSDGHTRYFAIEDWHTWDEDITADMQEGMTEYTEAEIKGTVQCMWDTFGGTETDKGFKMLDEHIGLIYGDSITMQRAEEIMQRLANKGFASNSVVLGIGSYTYQYNTRDTFGWAMKATWGQVNGEGIEIFKDPKTDSGTKKSAKGLLRVELEGEDYVLYDQQSKELEAQGELKVVFEDGKLFNQTTLQEIRERLWAQ